MTVKSQREYVRPEWRKIHTEALQAWAHAAKYEDSNRMQYIVASRRNKNLQIALVKWFQNHIGFYWDIHKKVFLKKKEDGEYFISSEREARNDPFWNYYEKRDVVYHKSGNMFEQKIFFDDIIETLRRERDEIDPALMRYFIHELNKFL